MRDIDKKIIALYKAGNTQKEVADKLSITRDAVRYSLSKHNVKPYAKVICCKECGDEYKTIRRWTKFCSDYCRLKHNKATILRQEVECEQCGKAYKTYKSKYCSDLCRALAAVSDVNQVRLINRAKRIHVKRCRQCGCRHLSAYRSKMYCAACRAARAKARAEKAKAKYTIKCSECGKWLETTRSRQKFCSIECGSRHKDRTKAIKRRERILLNGEVHWNISMERLIKRDKSICYLCEEKVDKNDFTINDGGHHISGDHYPSIEHVIPISKGGTHTWDNVKLAHRICNIIKSDKEITNESGIPQSRIVSDGIEKRIKEIEELLKK